MPSELAHLFESIDVGGGYRFRYYNSTGDEWKHMAHIFSAGVEVELPLEFTARARGAYEYRDFSDPSTFPDVELIDRAYALSNSDRAEHEVRVELEVEKRLTKKLSVSARWSDLDSESNRRVYDYNRHIVGGYLNYRFN